MITNEMIEFASEDIVQIEGCCLSWSDAQHYAHTAIEAAYPLIRKQVLEEAEEKLKTLRLPRTDAQSIGHNNGIMAAIRSLADE